MRRLLRDEGGQATTEYMLMLLVGLSLVAILIREVIRPLFARLQSVLTTRLDALFGGSGFHNFPVGR